MSPSWGRIEPITRTVRKRRRSRPLLAITAWMAGPPTLRRSITRTTVTTSGTPWVAPILGGAPASGPGGRGRAYLGRAVGGDRVRALEQKPLVEPRAPTLRLVPAERCEDEEEHEYL